MCYGPASTAAFATRQHAVNAAEDCRSALSGARPMARAASTPTRPLSPPSATSSRASPRRARRAASGYGFARKGSHSLCRCTRTQRSAGLRPATPPSTTCSQIPSMPAPTPMANHAGRRCWMQRVHAQSACDNCSALLQSLASCGHCGRRLHTHYRGRSSAPGYHCPGKILVEGRGVYCLNIGGIQIDEAVTRAFIAALEPAKLAATLAAAERLEADRETALKQWRLGVERASYEASRAERRYMAVDPDNRLVARGLERDWEQRLADLEAAKDELARRLEQ